VWGALRSAGPRDPFVYSKQRQTARCHIRASSFLQVSVSSSLPLSLSPPPSRSAAPHHAARPDQPPMVRVHVLVVLWCLQPPSCRCRRCRRHVLRPTLALSPRSSATVCLLDAAALHLTLPPTLPRPLRRATPTTDRWQRAVVTGQWGRVGALVRVCNAVDRQCRRQIYFAGRCGFPEQCAPMRREKGRFGARQHTAARWVQPAVSQTPSDIHRGCRRAGAGGGRACVHDFGCG